MDDMSRFNPTKQAVRNFRPGLPFGRQVANHDEGRHRPTLDFRRARAGLSQRSHRRRSPDYPATIRDWAAPPAIWVPNLFRSTRPPTASASWFERIAANPDEVNFVLITGWFEELKAKMGPPR